MTRRVRPNWKPPPAALLDASHPLAEGLCLCLPLLEGGGLSRSKDLSGNGWDLTTFTRVTWGTGPDIDGPALDCPAANSIVKTAAVNPTTAGFNPISTAFTAAARFYLGSVGAGGSDGIF